MISQLLHFLIRMKLKVLSFVLLCLVPTTVMGACSPTGYTIVTVNGIFTDKEHAVENMSALQAKLPSIYKGESLKIDYLYNKTHLAGLGDLVEAAVQKIFDNRAVDMHDFTNMLGDASQKISTQKVLLVAHSQGNFYANAFYDREAGAQGGIPRESLAVYGVATPSSRVAGGGLWLTSDTDQVIAGLVAKAPGEIRPPNIHVSMADVGSSNGHSFSGIYLKYHAGRVVKDIQVSLTGLRTNAIQSEDAACMQAPERSLAHQAVSVAYAVADPFAKGVRKTVETAAETPVTIAHAAVVAGNAIASAFVFNPQADQALMANIGASQRTQDFLNGKIAFAPVILQKTSSTLVNAEQASPVFYSPITPSKAKPDYTSLMHDLLTKITALI